MLDSSYALRSSLLSVLAAHARGSTALTAPTSGLISTLSTPSLPLLPLLPRFFLPLCLLLLALVVFLVLGHSHPLPLFCRSNTLLGIDIHIALKPVSSTPANANANTN
ncbi:hypothetical protein CCMSSC00406_0009558 [Pleurotus cornucopiae]|uniref:Uncharacterized protein n=1 Tax=Pleurotus cornucopiae TaxID=5321 RepID=A0ACB7IPR3_PLECO|nr:hypothetical protein CCMSSC00406_0009558 [Pleurotus cornucopiae]